MYDAWAAYDTTAVGYIYNEKISPLPGNPTAIEAARRDAAYRVLRSRFNSGSAGDVASRANFDAKLSALGYSPATGQAATTLATTPAELGKRIGQVIINWGLADGFSQTTYPQTYDATVNPNMATALAMSVTGNNGEFPSRNNMQLGVASLLEPTRISGNRSRFPRASARMEFPPLPVSRLTSASRDWRLHRSASRGPIR